MILEVSVYLFYNWLGLLGQVCYKGQLGFFLGCDTPWVSSHSFFWNGYVLRGIKSNTMLFWWGSNRGEWAYSTFSMSSSLFI